MKDMAFQVLDAFRARNQKRLRKINDVVLKEASLDFTPTAYELAVLSYVLSKIVSKPRFLGPDAAPRIRKIEDELRDLVQVLGTGQEAAASASFKRIVTAIGQLEKLDPRFVRDLVSKGRLKTAATMYAQGISLGLASEMTGISKQDILSYAGRTMMFDRIKEEMPVAERLKAARRALGGA
jgi:hypothetical protein